MSLGRTIAILLFAFVVGLVGYQIGVSQAIATQIPAGSGVPAAYPYWYGPGFGFGIGFFGLLFPLFFLFLFFGLMRAAIGGGRHWSGQGWTSRRERLEELHRELHGEKPSSGGTTTRST
jgi:hypothetical protein